MPATQDQVDVGDVVVDVGDGGDDDGVGALAASSKATTGKKSKKTATVQASATGFRALREEIDKCLTRPKVRDLVGEPLVMVLASTRLTKEIAGAVGAHCAFGPGKWKLQAGAFVMVGSSEKKGDEDGGSDGDDEEEYKEKKQKRKATTSFLSFSPFNLFLFSIQVIFLLLRNWLVLLLLRLLADDKQKSILIGCARYSRTRTK